jgi:hypothetical protein
MDLFTQNGAKNNLQKLWHTVMQHPVLLKLPYWGIMDIKISRENNS